MRPMLLVNPNLCQICARCQARQVCKLRAIVQLESGDLPIIEPQRCRGCQVCVAACPHGAIGPEDTTTRHRPPAPAPGPERSAGASADAAQGSR